MDLFLQVFVGPWAVLLVFLVCYVVCVRQTRLMWLQPAVYLVLMAFYNVYFHPLRKFPGPFWWTASRIPWAWHSFHGTLTERLCELQREHRDVIRVCPDELHFFTSQAVSPLMLWPCCPAIRSELTFKSGMVSLGPIMYLAMAGHTYCSRYIWAPGTKWKRKFEENLRKQKA